MVYLAITILLASILVPPLVSSSTWNDQTSNQYHIQTDEGPERYFKYQTTNGQYRKEKRLQDGTVIGTYAWIDDSGYLRQRDYIADGQGYRILKNKNVYVGKNVDVGNAMKIAKKNYGGAPQQPSRDYLPITPKPIYSNVQPSVDLSINSIPSSTPSSVYLPSSTPSSYYLPSSTLDTNDLIVPSSTPRPDLSYLPPSSTPLPPVSSYLPPKIPTRPSNVYIPQSTPSVTYPSSTPRPVSYLPPSVYLPSSTPPSASYLPSSTPSVSYLPSSTPPPVSYLPSSRPSVSYLPSSTPPSVSYLPSSTPSVSYLPSSKPSISYLPSSTPPSISYLPSSTPPPVSYLPASSPRPFAPSNSYLPSISTTTSPIYSPTTSPDYVSITPASRPFVPQQEEVLDSNSIEYPQYEHYPEDFVNPYIHQNGPTYPIDKRGHSFNPTYRNNIGNGYDPQYPYYDGISVTNDGFRYYIPRAYHEERNTNNQKTGSFGYIDPFGIRRVVYYNAGPDGFKHKKNNRYVGFNATPYDPRPY